MKRIKNRLSERYEQALASHLKLRSSRADTAVALGLGKKAISQKMQILQLARIHEQSLLALYPAGEKKGVLKRAEKFFTEVITPVINTFKAAREGRIALNRLNELLHHCTSELASTNRQLKKGISRRKEVEVALKKAGVDYSKLLKDSLQLQSGFRVLTHQVLAAQEDERKKISRELDDEVAQTLLGINVRLLALRKQGKRAGGNLKSEIASTQLLVAKSVKTVHDVAERLEKT